MSSSITLKLFYRIFKKFEPLFVTFSNCYAWPILLKKDLHYSNLITPYFSNTLQLLYVLFLQIVAICSCSHLTVWSLVIDSNFLKYELNILCSRFWNYLRKSILNCECILINSFVLIQIPFPTTFLILQQNKKSQVNLTRLNYI